MRRLLSLTLALALATAPLVAQVPADSTILRIIKERVDAGRFAGVAIGVVGKDGTRRVVAYGPNAGVQPFDGNTVFEIGSITKAFTAGILADMVNKGELALDDPVAKFLPSGTSVPSKDGRPITLLDLATHSSGLPRMPANFSPKDRDNPFADYSVQQMYEFLAAYQLTRGPGERYEYSNLGVGLLGHALALHAGKRYEDLVVERLLTPLRMADTRIRLTASMQQRLAPGHAADGTPVANWELPTFAGAGALRSTVNDMLIFVRANADSTSRPLGATLAKTHGERHAAVPAYMSIGLAWHRLKAPDGSVIVWHGGATGGYRTFAGYSEATGEGIVVLANTNNGVDEIGFHLLKSTLPLPPLPKPHSEVALSAEVLEKYTGTFSFTPTVELVVTRRGAQLFVQLTDQPRVPLFAERDDEFFLKVVDAQVIFTKDSTGAVTGLILHQNGLNRRASKR